MTITDKIESIIRHFDEEDGNFDDDSWYRILSQLITNAVAEEVNTVLKNTLGQTFGVSS